MVEEFQDFINRLPSSIRSSYTSRTESLDKYIDTNIGVVPIISVKSFKETLTSKDLYSQYRKDYLNDMKTLIEAYFPPLKFKILDSLQISDCNGDSKTANEDEAYISKPGQNEVYKVQKKYDRLNVFDIAKAVRSVYNNTTSKVYFDHLVFKS